MVVILTPVIRVRLVVVVVRDDGDGDFYGDDDQDAQSEVDVLLRATGSDTRITHL